MTHGIELKPENATAIAKQEIIQLVQHHDEHGFSNQGAE